MIFETDRLILRPWVEDDAEDLYNYAKSPDVGPAAGWPVHTSVENSREIIKNVLSADGVFAIVPKENKVAVGSIGLTIGKDSHLELLSDEGEIGYWIGVPYWGKGLVPEAVGEMLRHGFEDLKLKKIWCGYFDGNLKSKKVQAKCGFKHRYTQENVECPLINETRTEHISCITREEWKNTK